MGAPQLEYTAIVDELMVLLAEDVSHLGDEMACSDPAYLARKAREVAQHARLLERMAVERCGEARASGALGLAPLAGVSPDAQHRRPPHIHHARKDAA